LFCVAVVPGARHSHSREASQVAQPVGRKFFYLLNLRKHPFRAVVSL
jgi:hypothetical protein